MRSLLAVLALLVASAAQADQAAIENYFRTMDLNGDGFVSLAEAAGDEVIVSRFDKGDRNRDGKLSPREFANLSKVKVRVAKAKAKDQDKDGSAAVGGTNRVERKRSRAEKNAEAGG
jgi:hypothetical protein